MNIIDCHIHSMACRNYQEEIDRLISHMEQNGISQAVISDLGDNWMAFPDKDTLMTANSRLRDAALDSNGKLAFLVYINPQLSDWREVFDRFINDACGVKLWISLRTPEYGMERTKDVLRAAEQYGKAVLIHTFERTDPGPCGAIGVQDLIELANAVPGCRIVAAHAGGNWRKCIARAGEIPENVCFDISGSYPERTMVSRLTAAFGEDRILYGSDAYGRSFASQLSKVAYAGLDDAQMEKILYSNSRKIFGLPESTPVHAAEKTAFNTADDRKDNFCFAEKGKYFDHEVSVSMISDHAEKHQMSAVFAASLNALTCDDKIAGNQQYLQACTGYSRIFPLAAVDLKNMPEALRQLESINKFAGVIISPYLHNYKLEYEAFSQFFDACAERSIPVWINTALGDDRFRPEELHSRCVSADEITAFVSSAPQNSYVFQGCTELVKLSNALPEYCKLECSKLSDGEYLPEEFRAKGNVERLCFGSEYPFRDYGEVADVLSGRRFFS